jgi:hypothetical protein
MCWKLARLVVLRAVAIIAGEFSEFSLDLAPPLPPMRSLPWMGAELRLPSSFWPWVSWLLASCAKGGQEPPSPLPRKLKGLAMYSSTSSPRRSSWGFHLSERSHTLSGRWGKQEWGSSKSWRAHYFPFCIRGGLFVVGALLSKDLETRPKKPDTH